MCTSSPFCSPIKPVKFDSTEFTPFQSMFGLVPVLIIEMEIRSKPSSINSLSDKVGDTPHDFNKKDRVMMNICDQVKAQAKQNIDKAQERQKKSYDAKHQPLKFKEGKTLLLRNLHNEARKRSQTRVCVVRSLYHQQGVTKGSLQAPKRR